MAVLEALVPPKALELKIEVQDKEWVGKVDVGVATVVTRLQVHGQVEVVKRIRVPLLYHVKQVLLREPHWNVLDHHSSQHLYPIKNSMKVDRIVRKLSYL